MEFSAGRTNAELRKMFLNYIRKDKEAKADATRREILKSKINNALSK